MELTGIVSSDAHFTEPPDLWEKRLDKKFADRTPHVVSVENDFGWAPYLIWKMDQDYTQQARRPGWQRFRSDAVPSDFFRQNVFFSLQADAIGIKLRHEIGVDNLMFGTDYPQPESTFHRSRQILEEMLADVPEDEREKITRSNAAAMYGFDME